MLHNKILMTNDGQDVSYRVADDKDCTLPDETGNLIYGNVVIYGNVRPTLMRNDVVDEGLPRNDGSPIRR